MILASELTEELITAVTAWLRAFLPSWAPFRVVNVGKYLGLHLGPAAGAAQWSAPHLKWSSRTRTIAGHHAPVGTSCRLYNVRAITTLGYVGQLIAPSNAMLRTEKVVLTSLLHVPFNSMAVADIVNLHSLGLPKVKPVKALLLATLMRAAHCTVAVWKDWVLRFRRDMADYLPLSSLATGSWALPFWDSEPIAILLEKAYYGFLDDPELAVHCELAYREAMKVVNPNVAPAPRLIDTVKDCPKLQRVLYTSLVSSLYPNELPLLFAKRIRSFLPDMVERIPLINWPELVNFCIALPKVLVLALVKTWSNAWTTARRMHDEATWACPCCGCPNSDYLSHLIDCRALWFTPDPSSPADWHPQDPLARLCLLEVSQERALRLATAFHTYHGLRADIKAGVVQHRPNLGVVSPAALLERLAASSALVQSMW